jgi:elongation factor Ts
MTIAANLVKELRERSGAGMMECKKALVDANGDIEAAAELLRTRGQAKADKKAGRVAAEGRVEMAAAGGVVALVEVNCETDFVAKDQGFQDFARAAAELAASAGTGSVEALMAAGGGKLETVRRDLVAKIGENIAVRRIEIVRPAGTLASYFHGTRIGVLVDLAGGDADLGRDIAMHIAASRPQFLDAAQVPADLQDNERRILAEQAKNEGKPADIVAKMVDGRVRKYLAEISLSEQPFVKDPDITVAKLLAKGGATLAGFVRFEVGEGIEKEEKDFAAEVAAQLKG